MSHVISQACYIASVSNTKQVNPGSRGVTYTLHNVV